MIDIHCHILPYSDDGADSIDTSIEMCRAAFKNGIFTIIATPHYISGHKQTVNSDMVLKQVGMLNRMLESKNIDVTILAGMEVFISHDIMELYDSGKILTLNKSRYLLIEFPFNSIPLYADALLFKLMMKGLIPVIAHPERNSNIINDIGIASEYSRKGILFQVNAGSLSGRFGKKAEKTAKKLLTHNVVSFIASDAHSADTKTSEIIKAYKYVKNLDRNLSERIFLENPLCLINDVEISI